jgi:hypothetical protein
MHAMYVCTEAHWHLRLFVAVEKFICEFPVKLQLSAKGPVSKIMGKTATLLSVLPYTKVTEIVWLYKRLLLEPKKSVANKIT